MGHLALAVSRGGAQLEAEGLDDAENGGEFGVAVGAEGAIEALAGDAGFAGHVGHAAGAGHDSEGVGDKGGVSAFEGFGHVGGDGLAVVEVFGGVEGFGFGHCVSFASRSAVSMSRSCVFLSPPQRRMMRSSPRWTSVDPIAWAVVNAQFTHTFADGPNVSRIAEGQTSNSSGDSGSGLSITKGSEPRGEDFRLPNLDHNYSVAHGLQ